MARPHTVDPSRFLTIAIRADRKACARCCSEGVEDIRSERVHLGLGGDTGCGAAATGKRHATPTDEPTRDPTKVRAEDRRVGVEDSILAPHKDPGDVLPGRVVVGIREPVELIGSSLQVCLRRSRCSRRGGAACALLIVGGQL